MARDEVHNVLFVLRDCDEKRLDDRNKVYSVLDLLSGIFGAKVISRTHKHFGPHGLNVCFFLSTSHILYSSWPEHRAALLEVSTCGKLPDARKAEALLRKEFGCGKIESQKWSVKL